MHKIVIRLPGDRAFAGQLHVENQKGKVLMGPFPVCGRADDHLARENKNPDRNPLLPFGDTPLGEYEVRQIIKSGKDTIYSSKEFGSAGIILLGPRQGDAALADANGRFGFFIQGGDLSRQGLLLPTDGSLRLSNSHMQKLVKALYLIGENDSICLVINAGAVKKGIKVATGASPKKEALHKSKLVETIAGKLEFISVEASRRALLMKMMVAGRISISIPSMLMMTTNATMSQITSTLNQLTSGGKGSVLLASSFAVGTTLVFTTEKARAQDYSGAIGQAGTVAGYSEKAANDVSLEQAKVDSGLGFDTMAPGSVPDSSPTTPLTSAPGPSVTDFNPPSSPVEEEDTSTKQGQAEDEASEKDTTTDQATSSPASSYFVPASIAAAAMAPGIVSAFRQPYAPSNNAPDQNNTPVQPAVAVQTPSTVQVPVTNNVSQNQGGVNPQISKIMSSIDAIQVPPPLPQKDVSLTWKDIILNKDHSEALLQVGDLTLLAWDMAGRIGTKINFPCKVIMIAGKTFIAGEDGAMVYLIKQDKAYDDALDYLKNPATSKRFAQIVQDIKEGRPFLCFDSKMVKAARAINDPKLNNSGTQLAWDAMISPEAVKAMFKKACMETGTELVSSGTEGLVKELTERKGVFEAARIERKQAESLLRQTTDPAQQAQLMTAIQKTETMMENTYKLQEAGPKALGTIEGIFVSHEAEQGQGKSASD